MPENQNHLQYGAKLILDCVFVTVVRFCRIYFTGAKGSK